MKKFDKTALLVIAGSLILLIFIILFGSRRPVRVTSSIDDESLVSPWLTLSFEFSKAVDASLAAERWQVEPAIQGQWEWRDDRHATWQAGDPQPAGQILQFGFSAGPIGKDGSQFEQDQQWTVTIRNPLIVTIQTLFDSEPELFITDLDNYAVTEQITFTDGKVFDFTPSPDGEQIIYSVENTSGGLDFWLINQDGSDNQKVLDCADKRCSTAAWSPSTGEIAYTRDDPALDCDERIWLLDIDSGETAPLFENSVKTGYGPKWSPDGKWITYWNERENGIQLVERTSGEIHLLESYNGDTGCWSPDSTIFYYTNTILGETAFHNVILEADIENNTIETILGSDIDASGLNYENPECKMNQNMLVVSTQPNTNIPGKGLAAIDPETKKSTMIINDLTRIPSSYSWSLDGDYLLFQLGEVKADEGSIEIRIWDESGQQSRVILQGAKCPAWLP